MTSRWTTLDRIVSVEPGKSAEAIRNVPNTLAIFDSHFPRFPVLPGVLMRNARLKFICHDVHLRVERSDTPFTRGYNAGQVIRVPVAHGEGNYEADEETLKRLEGEGRVLYRYCSPEGVVDEAANINGAAHSIAGIVNDSGNVLGMMPHPENHVEDIMGCTDGRGLFAGLVADAGRG